MVASRLALIAVQIFAIVRGPTRLQKARERGCSVLRYGEGRTMSWGWGPYITSSWKDRNGQRKKKMREKLKAKYWTGKRVINMEVIS